MRPIHALILVAVLAALVGGLAFFLASDDPGGHIAGPTRTDPANAASAHGAANLTAPEDATPSDGPGSGGSVRSTVDNPDAPRARFELTGRLVDARGRAIANAMLYAVPGGEDFPIDFEGAEAPDFLQRVEARSGADGRFAIQPPSRAQVRLAARAGGFSPFDQTLALAGVAKDLGDVVMEDSAILEGRVVDSAHRGVAGAKLYRLREPSGAFFSIGGQSGVLVATADDQGRFRVDQLPAGPWKLRIASDDHPDKQESGTTEHPGQVVARLEFVLEDGLEIAGRVTGAPAELLPKLFVRASPRPSGNGGLGEMLDGADLFGASRKSPVAADGTFRVRGLKSGQLYRLAARDSESDFLGQSRTTPVNANAGDANVVLPYRAEAALVFQVVDAVDGKPVEQLSVSAGAGFQIPAMDERGQPIHRYPGGRVRFANFAGRPGAGEKLELTVEATGYRTLTRSDIALVEGQDTELGVLRLERAPLVRVDVVDAHTNAPVAGAQVALEEVQPEHGGVRIERRVGISIGGPTEDVGDSTPGGGTARTNEKGLASLTSRPGETVRVRVGHKGHAPWLSEPIALPSDGDHEVHVKLGPGGDVTVRVTNSRGEPVPGLAIEHRGPGTGVGFLMLSGAGEERTDAQGLVQFEHLMPGEHRFRVGESSGGTFFSANGDIRIGTAVSGDEGDASWTAATVVENETAVVNLLAPERSTVVGRVTEAGRPLAGARVELVTAEGDGPGGALALFGGGPNDQTDTKGEYKVNDVKVGRYKLEITHASRAMPWSADYEVRSGENRFDVDLPVAILEGVVTGPDGKPLAGVRVQAERAPDDSAGGGNVQRTVMAVFATDDGDGPEVSFGGGPASPTVQTDAEGRYKLRGVMPDVDLIVKAKAPDVQPAQSEKVRVAADQTKSHVDLRLEVGGALEATIVRPNGQPASSCMVLASWEGTGGPEPRHEFSGQKGVVKLSGLKPGRWRVHVDSFGTLPSGNERASIPDQTIEVVAGETARARFEVP